MIQDIAPHAFSNAFSNQPPADDSPVFAFYHGKVLVRTNAEGGREIALPCASDVWDGDAGGNYVPVFLFMIDDQRFYLALSRDHSVEPLQLDGFEWVRFTKLRMAEPFYMRLAVSTAWQLHGWYDTNRMCGRCGTPMDHGENHRALSCPTCKNTVYPRINPAVIVAVRNGDSLLMIKYAGPDAYRYRALVAGFCEIGETAEETVAREVLEEAGVRVKNIRYVASQPWGFASDLLLGFVCDLDGSPDIHRDNEELSYAEWVPRAEIYEEDDQVSLTRYLISAFKNGEL